MACFIILNGQPVNHSEAKKKLTDDLPEWEHDIYQFLCEWWNTKTFISVTTSGSTGAPKTIHHEKELMKASAQMTGEYFAYTSGQKVLLCLPAKFIAGKMMLVRALHWNLHVDYIEPKLSLKIPKEKYDFAAMTPPQVDASFKGIYNIEKLLLGGAPLSIALEKKLQNNATHCFVSYGMTETVSHIAIRDLKSDSSEIYTALPQVTFSIYQNNQLVIHAPSLLTQPIQTNDCVQLLNSKQFIWEGRSDFVINSGGLKISPERIESQISHLIESSFFIHGKIEEQWGQIPVLIIEGKPFPLTYIEGQMRNVLPKNSIPKEIYFIAQFNTTMNGKLDRKKTFEKILFLS